MPIPFLGPIFAGLSSALGGAGFGGAAAAGSLGGVGQQMLANSLVGGAVSGLIGGDVKDGAVAGAAKSGMENLLSPSSAVAKVADDAVAEPIVPLPEVGEIAEPIYDTADGFKDSPLIPLLLDTVDGYADQPMQPIQQPAMPQMPQMPKFDPLEYIQPRQTYASASPSRSTY